MARFIPEVERWRQLVAQYFRPEDVDAALAIMQEESRGNAGVPSTYNQQGTEDSWGLFQVNINAHGGTPQQWSDPQANVAKAAELYYGAGNWRDWLNSANKLGLPVQGQAAGGQQAMADPQPIGDPEIRYETPDGKPAGPPDQGGLFGWGSSNTNAIKIERITFDNGEVFDFYPDGRSVYVKTDAQVAAKYKASQPVAPSAASTTGQWITKTDPSTGITWRINEATGEKEQVFDAPRQTLERPQLPAISTTAPYYWVDGDNGPELKNNPNYRAPAPTRDPNQPAPRYPEDAEYARLRNQQLQQQLQNPLQLAMQQQNEALAAIQQKLAAGEIDVAEANRLMSLTRANLDSTLMGTTPWQQKTQQQNLARGVMGDRMQTGSSMAQGLLSGAGSIYGNILQSSGAPTNFDPMLLAKGFVNDMGGGAEMGELAKAILSGAMKPQGF